MFVIRAYCAPSGVCVCVCLGIIHILQLRCYQFSMNYVVCVYARASLCSARQTIRPSVRWPPMNRSDRIVACST